MSAAYLSSSSNNNQYLRPNPVITGGGGNGSGDSNANDDASSYGSSQGSNHGSSCNTPTGCSGLSDAYNGHLGHSPMDMVSPITPITPITPMAPAANSSSNTIHYKEISPPITPVQYKDLGQMSDAIIVDIRCYNHFSIKHLHNSINICIPSTLLKRKSYKLPQILASNSVDATTKSTILSQDCKLLFIDNNSSDLLSTNLYFTINKFLSYNSNYSVYYLTDGFDNLPQIVTENRALMDFGCKNNGAAECGQSHNVLSGFKLPSSTPANQKFIASVKRNALPKLDIKSIVDQSSSPGLPNGSTNNRQVGNDDLQSYHYSIKVPSFSESQLTNLPLWLKHFLVQDNGKVKQNSDMLRYLNAKFTKLEKSEQIRLDLAIDENGNATHGKCQNKSKHLNPEFQVDHSNICSPNSPCPNCDNIVYKIPKGIEYGFKNRYNNIWPYEHSRVRLTSSPYDKPGKSGDQFITDDDYFNANYIHFPSLSDSKYIATQNPLKSTIKDFWNIVYNNKVNLIICLNQQYQLTDNYFDTQSIGNYSIEMIELKTFEHYKLRKIKLTKFNHSFLIHHLEFTEWPDFGVPNIEWVLEFIQFKNTLVKENELNNYTLVHCSAGCGRTGCFIAVDSLINSFKFHADNINSQPQLYSSGKKLNPYDTKDLVYKSIQFQRQQRISMCQNFDQYIFCYEAILHHLQQTL